MTGVRPFLFGKLPAFGDFLARGLSGEAQAEWDERCSAAIAQAQTRLGPEFDRLFEATAPRSVLRPLPDAVGRWEAAVVAPSRDRVGRAYLFVLGAAGAWPARRPARAVFDRLQACLYEAFAQPPSALDGLLDTVARMFGEEVGTDAAAIADWMPWDSGWIGSPDMTVPHQARSA